MHLGNVFSALMSWLDARSCGGQWVLRIEDLDPQRSRIEYARQIEDDLHWLGLDWDEGGLDGAGENGPYLQSRRGDIYERYLNLIQDQGVTYPCTCTRADILATQAPHQSDGRVVYGGRCRPSVMPAKNRISCDAPHATRLWVPDKEIGYNDLLWGGGSVNLARECGDFILRRADGAWSYQLAVVVDDALMGVTRVVRGNDLLLSAAQQNYLYGLLGFPSPEYAHVPLLVNSEGRRLSKRDGGLNMASLRKHKSAAEIIGNLAHAAGLIPHPDPVDAADLISIFSWEKVPRCQTIQANVQC